MADINYEEKITVAQQQIENLEADTAAYPDNNIVAVENGREIKRLQEKITFWMSRMNETPEEKAVRLAAEEKEAERLDAWNRNFRRLEENDRDY